MLIYTDVNLGTNKHNKSSEIVKCFVEGYNKISLKPLQPLQLKQGHLMYANEKFQNNSVVGSF